MKFSIYLLTAFIFAVLPFLLIENHSILIAQAVHEWGGTSEAPENISWKTVIASADEPGDRIVLSGTVFHTDGKTPASDITIYVYHTNSKGIYPKRGNETGNGVRHGYLRGWMKTGEDGRYEFETIKPAPYPGLNSPAHIHITLAGENYPEYWISSFWFEGDPIITQSMRKNIRRQGGFPNIIQLTRDQNGILRGERNIILEILE